MRMQWEALIEAFKKTGRFAPEGSRLTVCPPGGGGGGSAGSIRFLMTSSAPG